MSISEVDSGQFVATEGEGSLAQESHKVKSGRGPGHARGAALVIIFAALWSQLVAAVTMVLMWYSWQEAVNLAWPDNDRIILMSVTLLTVLIFSYVLAGRFWRRRAAERTAFAEIWYTSGAVAGAWFGLPLYLSVTWDHQLYGGHDAFTIISVGAIFVFVGGLFGLVLAAPTEFLAWRLYRWGQQGGEQIEKRKGRQGGKWGGGLMALASAPLVLSLGGLLTFGLLFLTGPGPLADATYKGAMLLNETSVNGTCMATIRSYSTSDGPTRVSEYYKNLASGHKYTEFVSWAQLDRAKLGPLAEKLQPGPQSLGVRYSNTPFYSDTSVSAYSTSKSGLESCRSQGVFLQPDNKGGTLIQLVNEKPGHMP